ncbi:hypothetical protein [Planococcus sp. YIM B11945]|uniref:hypothetical protein n=1 Tax=Planococcus sp. YIM B11945 TaxID=3435410 RepID=UPI003D7D5631
MKKYAVLCGGLGILALAFFSLYMGYAPKTGPLNGPNDKLLWFNLAVQLFSGICFTALAGLMFYKEKDAK